MKTVTRFWTLVRVDGVRTPFIFDDYKEAVFTKALLEEDTGYEYAINEMEL